MPTGTILLADDEEFVRAYIRSILRVGGFSVLEAADGTAALRLVEERGAPIDLLLTDIRMPGMDGIELARSVLNVYPKTPVLYISGYPFDLQDEQTRHPVSACAFLAKPFTRQALLEAVQKCLCPPKERAGAVG